MRGIFAIDPGIHTGLAWAVVNNQAATVAEAMRKRIFSDSLTIEGDEYEQMVDIFATWQKFKTDCYLVHNLEPDQVDLVIEKFSLIPGAHAGGSEGISPERIGWAFEGYRLGRAAKFKRDKHITQTVWQHANALKYRKQLKKWDAWVVGKEHERAAFCHIGQRLMTLFKQPRAS
jgi:hypothetical protein